MAAKTSKDLVTPPAENDDEGASKVATVYPKPTTANEKPLPTKVDPLIKTAKPARKQKHGGTRSKDFLIKANQPKEHQIQKAARRAKNKSEHDGVNEHLLKEGDDVSPLGKKSKAITKLNVTEEDEDAASLRVQDIQIREQVKLVKNKDNNGKLFVNNRPFWRIGGNDEDTNENLPLASSIVLDVANKKVTLVEPPEEHIFLDPYAEQSFMAARDAKFFTKDLVFANAVRSIIATTGPDEEHVHEDLKAFKNVVYKEYPKTMFIYKHDAVSHDLMKKEAQYIRTNKGVIHAKKGSAGAKVGPNQPQKKH